MGQSQALGSLVLRSGDDGDVWKPLSWNHPSWGNPISDPLAKWTWSSSQFVDKEVHTYNRDFYIDGPPTYGKLTITCDNSYQAFINDLEVGSDGDWYSAETYDCADKLRQGANTLKIIVANEYGPAGLLYRLELGSGASEKTTQIPGTDINSEKQPLDVKLVVYPEKTTDVDVIEIEAEVSGDYKTPLNYVWYKDNVKLEGETGYKIRLESGVLPGEYMITVQVTDDEGRTGEAWNTLNVVEGDTGIRGDVLEVVLFDPIPNAIVSATSLKSGTTKTVNVSPDGKYSIHLMPGNYKVSASAPGYLTESGTFGDDVKVLSPHDEPYCIDCYTTFNFRLVMEPTNGGKPCGTHWTKVFPDLNLNPCNVTMGPPVPTGSYMIWVSPVEGPMGSEPQDWKNYGPYQFRAKHYYSVVVKGDYGNSRVVVTEDDPETSCYESMPMPGYAYIYYRNDVISYRLLHYAMTICPVE